jgi:hypothetical protein
MVRTLKYILPYILVGILFLVGCSSLGGTVDPGYIDSSEEMVFEEDEVTQDEDNELVFDESEGSLVAASNVPPGGTWLWSNSEPSYEGCPVSMANAPVPPDPPREVGIELSEDGNMMRISADGSTVELARTQFNETVSAYQGEIAVPVGSGESLRVEYYLDYNLFDDATLGGTIVSHLPEFDGCQAIRSFVAEYIP